MKGLTKRQTLSAANSEQNRERTVPEQLLRNQFKPGQSGNPSGRPKKKPITELLEQIANDPKAMAKIKAALIEHLIRGDIPTVNLMADRLEGKVTQTLEHTGRMTLEQLIIQAKAEADESSDT